MKDNKEKQPTNKIVMKRKSTAKHKDANSYINVDLSRYTIKNIRENKILNGVYINGVDNQFSNYLDGLALKSVTQSNIIADLTNYIVGKGLIASDPKEQKILDKFFKKRKTKKLVKYKLIQFTLTFEIIKGHYTNDIKEINIHNPTQYRVHAMDEGEPVSFVYRRSWDKSDYTNYRTGQEVPLIDFDDENQKSGLYYWYDSNGLPVPYGRPDYISGTDAIEMEISAYTGYNHGIQNGNEPSKIIEMVGTGDPEADKEDIAAITADLSGVANRGKLAIRMRPSGAEPMTISESGSSELGANYASTFELAEIGILKANRIVSPSLIAGINTKNSGFSSPAEEMQWAKEELYFRFIEDEREEILELLDPIFEQLGIESDVYFEDRIKEQEAEAIEEQPEVLKAELKEQDSVLDLIATGSDIEEILSDGWSIAHIGEVDYDLEDELDLQISKLNNVALASTGQAFPNAKSEQDGTQDNIQYKVRYQYAGSNKGERDFCSQMVRAKKVYRKEDLVRMGNNGANAGFGIDGAANYSIFMYKGGPNCKHYFERITFIKDGLEGSIDTRSPNAKTMTPVQSNRAGFNPNTKAESKTIRTIPYNMPNHGYYKPR